MKRLSSESYASTAHVTVALQQSAAMAGDLLKPLEMTKRALSRPDSEPTRGRSNRLRPTKLKGNQKRSRRALHAFPTRSATLNSVKVEEIGHKATRAFRADTRELRGLQRLLQIRAALLQCNN